MKSDQREIEGLYEAILHFSGTYLRVFIKATLICLMTMFSVWTYAGSLSKALLFGCAFFIISMFQTWRRILEPVSLLVFCAAAVYTCDQNFLSHVKIAFAQ